MAGLISEVYTKSGEKILCTKKYELTLIEAETVRESLEREKAQLEASPVIDRAARIAEVEAKLVVISNLLPEKEKEIE